MELFESYIETHPILLAITRFLKLNKYDLEL